MSADGEKEEDGEKEGERGEMIRASIRRTKPE